MLKEEGTSFVREVTDDMGLGKEGRTDGKVQMLGAAGMTRGHKGGGQWSKAARRPNLAQGAMPAKSARGGATRVGEEVSRRGRGSGHV